MNDKYILNGKTPIIEPDLSAWSKWFKTANRHVAITEIGEVKVSTVFLGLDHSFGFSKVPVLFETMIFGFPDDHKLANYQKRYATWKKAEEGHKIAVKLVEESHE